MFGIFRSLRISAKVLFLQLHQCFFAGSGDYHLETVAPEDIGDQFADFLLVVHHQAVEPGRFRRLLGGDFGVLVGPVWKPAAR